MTSLPWCSLWLLILISTASVAFYGAVVGGIYKDPLLARFRAYGEERRPYPVCRFLEVAALWCVLIAILLGTLTSPYSYWRSAFPPLILLVLGAMSFGTSLFVRRQPALREALPRWYYDLLHNANRQERRFIGWAWLRIPRKMRWRLNGDQAAFHVWADMVRITVIYGARDPDDPWAVWN
jgi:hypothetical protein